MSIIYEIIKSWKCTEGAVNSLDDIKAWVEERNNNLHVDIKKIPFPQDGFWYLDKQTGYIKNKNNSFFQLAGYQKIDNDAIVCEQPVILQNEIGYLGMICKMINGTLHFLMQAKIEPGNVNVIQLSPTIQATRSNFLRKHGGNAPAYLEYFENAKDHVIVVDQIQSEQSSRFYKKRNRNIIILVSDEIELLSSHKWMTLGQIKACMKIDNLVNMDTRTVLSCIPYSTSYIEDAEKLEIEKLFNDKALYNSMFESKDGSIMQKIYNDINDYKMYLDDNAKLIPLEKMNSWKITDREIVCRYPYDFKIIYCYIEIEGREVRCWEQPLVEANGKLVLGTFTCVCDGVRKFMVSMKPEIGCFDSVELGPVVQLEPSNPRNDLDEVESYFLQKMELQTGVIKDVIQSEEGGRFYHEENRNVIIEIDINEIPVLPKGYYWVDYNTLNHMVRFNNCLNIQLRNLLSLLDI